MSRPAVSVVVLTWNREALLRETLGSILAQTYRDIEVLVVDNMSTDGTAAYLEDLAARDERVRHVRHANEGSIARNRNVGVREAAAGWIAFCDDDDLWEPGKLARQMELAEARPEVAIVCSDVLLFDERGEIGRHVGGRGADITLGDLLGPGLNPVMTSSAVVRRDVFERAGGWDESLDVATVEDWELWVAAAAAGFAIAYVDEPLVRYRVHAGSMSHRDTRVTAAKQRVAIERLRARGALSEAQLAEGLAGLAAKSRVAGAKELVKRIPGATALASQLRRRRHRRSGG